MSDKKQSKLYSLEGGLGKIAEKPKLYLLVVGFIGLIIRLYYLPFDVPLILDSTGYFWYGIDTIVSGHFPTADCGWRCTFPNNGWPALLTGFFIFLNSDNFLDYMNLQRLLSVAISVLTIIPIYLLCSRFAKKQYALFAASLFVFNPRLIQNSLLGITEPLFILTFTFAVFLFLSSEKKFVYASFAVAGITSLVRYEGLLLLIPFSVMFFVRFRKEKKIIIKYILAISIFMLIVLPMAYVRVETTGRDGLISHVTAGPTYYQSRVQESEVGDEVLGSLLRTGAATLARFLVLSSIPTFIFLVPAGLYVLFKNRESNNITILLIGIMMMIPSFYAYSRNFQEVRYLLILFPLFCILSVYTVKLFESKFRHSNIILISLIGIVLITSILFLNYKLPDYEYQEEAYQIAHRVYKITKVVNYYPQGSYLDNARTASSEVFPTLRIDLPPNIRTIYFEGFSSIEDYIEKNRNEGLTYLVVDKGDYRTRFLDEIFIHEENYPYLSKVFDSFENGYTHYHVKIFKINFEKFDSIRS